MVHDVVISVFEDVPEIYEIHPSKKNAYRPDAGVAETGKMTKRNTKAIARQYMTPE
jgi:hypothetical protein